MQKFLNVETINLRPVASTSGNTPVGALTLGQPVEDLEDGPPGWHHVRATLGGQPQVGFIVDGFADSKFKWTTAKQPTLRDPSSPAREALVAAAIAQWVRFEKGTGKESVEKFSNFIAQMWKALGKNLTGHDDVPWSAVAISLMVRDAAASFPDYAKFPESIGHARYMWSSIKAATASDTSAAFWGKRLVDAMPEVGDIIGSWREKPSSYDKFLAAPKNPESPSHCDIVVAVGSEVALAIGGNVQNSVFATGYQLTPAGFFTLNQRFSKSPPPNGAVKLVGEAIVLMKNRAG